MFTRTSLFHFLTCIVRTFILVLLLCRFKGSWKTKFEDFRLHDNSIVNLLHNVPTVSDFCIFIQNNVLQAEPANVVFCPKDNTSHRQYGCITLSLLNKWYGWPYYQIPSYLKSEHTKVHVIMVTGHVCVGLNPLLTSH